MSVNAPTLWGIRAGSRGEADALFLQKNYIAIGWPLGDLSSLPSRREAFKKHYSVFDPAATPPQVANNAGQIYRFVHEIKVGDIAVYPSKVDHLVHIGEITGPYVYNPKLNPDFPHLRAVKWHHHISRLKFSQGALFTLGAIQTLFKIENYADELLAVFQEKVGNGAVLPPTEDRTLPAVAENIEETTRDFVLKRLSQDLKGHGFAYFVAHLLNAMGYRTRVSPPGADGGLDIIAHKDELGFEPPIIKVQVKSSSDPIANDVVQALYGQVTSGEYGMVITLGRFKPSATNFARGKPNLRLIDSSELLDMIYEHYEQFSPHYKAIIPLKRVYVPTPPDQPEI